MAAAAAGAHPIGGEDRLGGVEEVLGVFEDFVRVADGLEFLRHARHARRYVVRLLARDVVEEELQHTRASGKRDARASADWGQHRHLLGHELPKFRRHGTHTIQNCSVSRVHPRRELCQWAADTGESTGSGKCLSTVGSKGTVAVRSGTRLQRHENSPAVRAVGWRCVASSRRAMAPKVALQVVG